MSQPQRPRTNTLPKVNENQSTDFNSSQSNKSNQNLQAIASAISLAPTPTAVGNSGGVGTMQTQIEKADVSGTGLSGFVRQKSNESESNMYVSRPRDISREGTFASSAGTITTDASFTTMRGMMNDKNSVNNTVTSKRSKFLQFCVCVCVCFFFFVSVFIFLFGKSFFCVL